MATENIETVESDADKGNSETVESGADKGKRILKSIVKKFCYFITFIAVVNWFWVMSGDSEWVFEKEQDGVKIYSMKASGNSVKKFKGIVEYKDATIDQLVSMIVYNDTLENCKDWIPTCTGFEPVEAWNPRTLSDVNLWTFDMLPGFSPRQMILKAIVDKVPNSNQVTVDVFVLPTKVPLDDCCVRLTHMHNTWLYTPLEGGGVEVQFVQNISMGGYFPDFLINIGGVMGTHDLLHTFMPKMLDDPKYQNVEYDFLR